MLSVYVVEPMGQLCADREALRTGLLIQADPLLGRQFQAQEGDFFGHCRCNPAQVVQILELPEETRTTP